MGGDEPHFDCWDADAKVAKYMAEKNLSNTGLYGQFEAKYAALLASHGKKVVGWEEIQTTHGTNPSRDSTVIEVWEGNDALAGVVQAGYRAIVSSNWYLNNGGDWSKYYTDDPMSYLPKNASSQVRYSPLLTTRRVDNTFPIIAPAYHP